MNWGLGDVILFGVMLAALGVACGVAVRLTRNPTYRLGLCGLAVLLFLLVWAELAVGLFD
jgi:hypothetical protein